MRKFIELIITIIFFPVMVIMYTVAKVKQDLKLKNKKNRDSLWKMKWPRK